MQSKKSPLSNPKSYHHSIVAKNPASFSTISQKQSTEESKGRYYQNSQQPRRQSIQMINGIDHFRDFEEIDHFIQPISNPDHKNKEEKPTVKPRFTLLDDDELDDLDEALNGHRTRENVAEKQAMKQAYEQLKQQYEAHPLDSSDSKDSEPQNINYIKEQKLASRSCHNFDEEDNKKKQKPERVSVKQVGSKQKNNENKNIMNEEDKRKDSEKVKQVLEVKVPRIFVSYKKINLLDPPKEENFYSLGLDEYIRDARAPRNSFIVKNDKNSGGQDCDLFHKALQEKKMGSANQQNRFGHFHQQRS